MITKRVLIAIAAAIVALILIGIAATMIIRANPPEQSPTYNQNAEYRKQGELKFVNDQAE